MAGIADDECRQEVAQIYAGILKRAPEHDVQPSLERVAAVMDILAQPQDLYPVVHITGTNGKTSTARMIEALLGEWGMKTGRFTSPHLSDVRERIALNGEPISGQKFVDAYADIIPYVDMVDAAGAAAGKPRLSFFEVFTVMALAAFAEAPVDVGIVEVGMGGRWDATNVVNPVVSVITPISRDHEKWLGKDIAQIAKEKAGIIKPDSIVLLGRQPEAAQDILMQAAREAGVMVRQVGHELKVLSRALAVGGQLLTLQTPAGIYEDIYLPLHGEHQSENALLALGAAEAFFNGRQIPAQVVEAGFGQVRSPGRLEFVRSSPTVLVDCAHNPGGAQVLAQTLEHDFTYQHWAGVYSSMADKDVEGVLAELEPVLEELVVTSMPTERAMDISELANIAIDVFGPDRVRVEPDLATAIDVAATLAEAGDYSATAGAVVVFGSVVLAGQVRTLCGLT